MSEKRHVGLRLRRQIWREQEGRCWYCGWPIVPSGGLEDTEAAAICCLCHICTRKRTGTRGGRFHLSGLHGLCLVANIDHIRPHIFGGGAERENLVYACYACNQLRLKLDHRVAAQQDEMRVREGVRPVPPEQRAKRHAMVLAHHRPLIRSLNLWEYEWPDAAADGDGVGDGEREQEE